MLEQASSRRPCALGAFEGQSHATSTQYLWRSRKRWEQSCLYSPSFCSWVLEEICLPIVSDLQEAKCAGTLTLQDAQSSEIRKRDLELFDCRRACHVRLGGAGLSSLLYFGHFAEDGEENEENGRPEVLQLQEKKLSNVPTDHGVWAATERRPSAVGTKLRGVATMR